MTERKVLNRYYPVDYDPAKIPKLKRKQKEANRLWGIRVMAPFNMRCNTCGEYIYKGKKFNSKKETVENEDYLGIQIHRFYIRCPRCVAVIAFKTDPENCDYTCEAGATRNFEAAKTLLDMEKKKQKEAEEEEAANPMKVLENRTKQSRNEMDTIEAINELKELNARNEKVDHDLMIKKQHLFSAELERLQKEAEDRMIRDLFGGDRAAMNGESSDGSDFIKRIEDNSDSSDDEIQTKIRKYENPTDLLSEQKPGESDKPVNSKPSPAPPKKNSQKALLSGLIIKKKSAENGSSSETTSSSTSSATAGEVKETLAEKTKAASDTYTNDDKQSGALTLLGGYSDSDSSESD